MVQQGYASDLTKAQWAWLAPLLAPPGAGPPRQEERARWQRAPAPSVVIIDSQSVRTTGKGGPGLRWGQSREGPPAAYLGGY